MAIVFAATPRHVSIYDLTTGVLIEDHLDYPNTTFIKDIVIGDERLFVLL